MEETKTLNEDREIKNLLKVTKKVIGYKEELARFKEPVLLLLRRNGEVSIYHGVKDTQWQYEHTDTTMRVIFLNTAPYNMPYAGETFKMWICHEDFPFPMPMDIMTTTEEVTTIIDKVGAGMNKLLIEGLRAKTSSKVWMYVAIIAVIGIFFLFGLPAISDYMAARATQKATEAAAMVAQNLTNLR